MKRTIVAFTFAAVLVIGGLAVRRASTFQWLSESPGAQPPSFAFLGAARLPLLRAWLWVKSAVAGPRVNLLVEGTLWEFVSLRPLLASTNVVSRRTNDAGDQLWLIADGRAWAKELSEAGGANVLSRPRFMVGDGARVQASSRTTAYGVTNRTVGSTIDIRIRRSGARGFDLTCFVAADEIGMRTLIVSNQPFNEPCIHTNFFCGARVRMPTNGAMFLLSSRTNARGCYVGASVSAARR